MRRLALFLTMAALWLSPTAVGFSPHSAVTHAQSSQRQRQRHRQSQSQSQLHADVPRDSQKTEKEESSSLLADLKSWMPPPPEDQFIMTGDIFVLFLYAFTSHYLNNFVVDSVISNSDTIQEALSTLDPAGEVTSLQHPVWVAADQPQIVQSVLTLNAQDSLLNHWGPLFSTAGSACVALCTCWLIAGWWHRAFLFQNSLDCEPSQALVKTIQAWTSMVVLMMLLVLASNTLVTQMPSEWMQAISAAPTLTPTPTTPTAFLTKADMMFLVDSASVLIAWRYMANAMMKFFR